MNREDYILFIDGGLSNDGVGFFIGNTFITAGHVINDNIIHTINVNGRKIELKKSDAIYLNCAEYDNVSPDIPDLAIFEFKDINSPLILANDSPTEGQCLEFISKRRVVENNKVNGIPSIFTQSESIKTYSCKGEVVAHDADYWECHTDKILRKGDSGSPVMKGNFVYGVLVGGKPGTPKCAFISAERILKIIENKKIIQYMLND